MRSLLFVLGIVVLVLSEFFRVYFIMPFPGSQMSQTIDIAYFLHDNINYFRLIGIFMITFPMFYFWRLGKRGHRIAIALGALAAIAELRQPFDRGFVFLEIESADESADGIAGSRCCRLLSGDRKSGKGRDKAQ